MVPRDFDEHDPFYAWLSDDEAAQVRELWASLEPEEREQLSSAPEDIRHDLMLCRFLRGHGPRALQALRGHLQFRQENRELLERIRRSLPPDMEDFDLSSMPQVAEVHSRFSWLQLPARHGSNDGMPLSMIAAGRMDLDAFGSLPDSRVWEWFMTCCEIRSLCLHNQSMRQRRMARVVEVRDVLGFNWSTFLTSRGAAGKFRLILAIAVKYPELLGGVVIFNLEPATWLLRVLRRLIPKEMEHKFILATRGDWEAVAGANRGLSPAALVKYYRNIAGALGGSSDFSLTAKWPQAVNTLQVAAGREFSWRAECEAHGGKAPDVLVRVRFLAEGRSGVTVFTCAGAATLRCRRAPASCAGSFRAPAQGFALIEAELQGRGRSEVRALLSLTLGAQPPAPTHVAGQPVASGARGPPVPVSAARSSASADRSPAATAAPRWPDILRFLSHLLLAMLLWRLLVPLLLAGGGSGAGA